jgi:hypothetical protein
MHEPEPHPLRAHPARTALVLGMGLALSLIPESAAAAQVDTAPQSISSIQTRSPYCYQPDRERNECFLGFEYHFVSTTASMRHLQITIGGKRVIEDRAFFQTNLFIGISEAGRPGYRVACGLSGSGGDPDPLIGQRYSFQIREPELRNPQLPGLCSGRDLPQRFRGDLIRSRIA